MTVHRNRFLVNKTNRCTEFQFYWYYYSTCFGQPFCPSSGVLSHTSALVHFMQLWWPFDTRSRMELRSILPETCRVVIPIKLEFSASVGFIHKGGNINKVFCCHWSWETEGNHENSHWREPATRLLFELSISRLQSNSGRGTDMFRNFEAL
jgi:hypothetical protein